MDSGDSKKCNTGKQASLTYNRKKRFGTKKKGVKKSNEDQHIVHDDTGERTDKKNQESSDDDFQSKKQKVHSPKQAASKNPQPYIPYSHKRLYMRNKAENICDIFSHIKLSKERLEAISNIGFITMKSLSVTMVPNNLSYWLLSNYDHDNRTLNLGTKSIKLDRKMVHDVLGIPMGKKKVLESEKGSHKEPVMLEWRAQWPPKSGLRTVKHVFDMIKNTSDAGRMFCLNFLVIVLSTLAECTKQSTVNMRFLKSLPEGAIVQEYDWCSYVIECLNRTKKAWNGVEHYNGPITFLGLWYAHIMRKGTFPEGKQTPAIGLYTTHTLRELEDELVSKNYKVVSEVDLQMKEEYNVKVKVNIKRKRSKGPVSDESKQHKFEEHRVEEHKVEGVDENNITIASLRKRKRVVYRISSSSESEDVEDYVDSEKDWISLFKKKTAHLEMMIGDVDQMIMIANTDFPNSKLLKDVINDWKSLLTKYSDKEEPAQEDEREVMAEEEHVDKEPVKEYESPAQEIGKEQPAQEDDREVMAEEEHVDKEPVKEYESPAQVIGKEVNEMGQHVEKEIDAKETTTQKPEQEADKKNVESSNSGAGYTESQVSITPTHMQEILQACDTAVKTKMNQVKNAECGEQYDEKAGTPNVGNEEIDAKETTAQEPTKEADKQNVEDSKCGAEYTQSQVSITATHMEEIIQACDKTEKSKMNQDKNDECEEQCVEKAGTPKIGDEVDVESLIQKLPILKTNGLFDEPSFDLFISQLTPDVDTSKPPKTVITPVPMAKLSPAQEHAATTLHASTSAHAQIEKPPPPAPVLHQVQQPRIQSPPPAPLLHQVQQPAVQRPSRVTRPGDALRSPYKERKVAVGKRLTKLELIMGKCFLYGDGEKSEKLFESAEGNILRWNDIHSMYEKSIVDVNVINCWAQVLNVEESAKSRDSPARLFCSCDILAEENFQEDCSKEERIDIMTINIDVALQSSIYKTIRSVDLLFCPMNLKRHFYVICFDFLKPALYILDNVKDNLGINERYGNCPKILRDTLAAYLTKVNTAKSKKISTVLPKRLSMPWQTTNNVIDGGIFAMRHMETFMGGPASHWENVITEVSSKQKIEINDLRVKYMVKILLSDFNKKKAVISDKINSYETMNADEKERWHEMGVNRIKEEKMKLVTAEYIFTAQQDGW
ncbi:hypothetical protein SSX86_008580 [Deinandra increscens subsp. villosa]|uniref:Ubiquitin-like protease family profile domain-containing protein n=1 Tax=Deinandra increscens subsp. villosa TaxID=3103831 RepID=A0AAP0H260_9ASTR